MTVQGRIEDLLRDPAPRRLMDEWRSLSAQRRREARGIVPLAEQRRELWDGRLIEEGAGLLARTLGKKPISLRAAALRP